MPDLWVDVDVEVTLPVNILPLMDDTTFKDIEDAVAYDATGMALYWHFETCAGVKSVTQVTPANTGNYLWTDEGTTGTYKIQMPATGGTSGAMNNTEGCGYFTGKCSGVLPWRSPTIGFRAAGLNDALIESAYSTTRGLAGTALPAAAADAAGGLPISDAGGLDLDTLLATLTNGTYGLSALETLVDELESRLSAARAGYLDNLSAGAVATATAIAALNNLSAAQVNAEVVDALNTDTYAEPGQGNPPATATLVQKIGYLYKNWRNKKTQTSSEWALYADDTTTKDQEAAVSDDGTTTTKGEIQTGA